MLSKKFKEPVFLTNVILFVGTPAELNKYLGEEIFGEGVNGFYETDNINILLSSESGNILKWLTHELTHFIYEVLKKKGIDHTGQTDEVFAYFYGYYFDVMYKRLHSKGLDF